MYSLRLRRNASWRTGVARASVSICPIVDGIVTTGAMGIEQADKKAHFPLAHPTRRGAPPQ